MGVSLPWRTVTGSPGRKPRASTVSRVPGRAVLGVTFIARSSRALPAGLTDDPSAPRSASPPATSAAPHGARISCRPGESTTVRGTRSPVLDNVRYDVLLQNHGFMPMRCLTFVVFDTPRRRRATGSPTTAPTSTASPRAAAAATSTASARPARTRVPTTRRSASRDGASRAATKQRDGLGGGGPVATISIGW